MTLFNLREAGTTVRTEILAGLTTWLAMVYIVAVNPSILATTGMDQGALFVATCLSAGIASIAMGLYANYLTPGQGDGGVDAIATDASGRVLFVQCKHTGHGVSGRIDEKAILDLCRARDSLRHRYPQPRLLAITNGRFSLAAENLAQERGVDIVDGMRLPQLSDIAAGLN